MANQKTDPDKLWRIHRKHDRWIELFKKGKLNGKIGVFLKRTLEREQVSETRYREFLKHLKLDYVEEGSAIHSPQEPKG